MLFITAHNSTRTLKHTTYRRQPNDEKQALPQYPQHTRHLRHLHGTRRQVVSDTRNGEPRAQREGESQIGAKDYIVRIHHRCQMNYALLWYHHLHAHKRLAAQTWHSHARRRRRCCSRAPRPSTVLATCCTHATGNGEARRGGHDVNVATANRGQPPIPVATAAQLPQRTTSQHARHHDHHRQLAY